MTAYDFVLKIDGVQVFMVYCSQGACVEAARDRVLSDFKQTMQARVLMVAAGPDESYEKSAFVRELCQLNMFFKNFPVVAEILLDKPVDDDEEIAYLCRIAQNSAADLEQVLRSMKFGC